MDQSFDKRVGKIWFNGKLIDWEIANVHVLNHGLHYASSVFEGERAYNGKVFKSKDHSERLFNAAKTMDMKIPFTIDDVLRAKEDLLNANNLVDAYVRPVVWRGSEMMAISAQKNKIHVAIATWEWGSYFDPKLKVEGIRLNIFSGKNISGAGGSGRPGCGRPATSVAYQDGRGIAISEGVIGEGQGGPAGAH